MAEVLPRIRVIDPQARNGSPMTSPTNYLANGSKDARTTSGDTPEGNECGGIRAMSYLF